MVNKVLLFLTNAFKGVQENIIFICLIITQRCIVEAAAYILSIIEVNMYHIFHSLEVENNKSEYDQ